MNGVPEQRGLGGILGRILEAIRKMGQREEHPTPWMIGPGSPFAPKVWGAISRMAPGYGRRAEEEWRGIQTERERQARLGRMAGVAGFGPALTEDLRAGAGWGGPIGGPGPMPMGVEQLAEMRIESAARHAEMERLQGMLDAMLGEQWDFERDRRTTPIAYGEDV